jgi:hypothetical protein
MQTECAGGEPPITPMHFPGHRDDSKRFSNELAQNAKSRRGNAAAAFSLRAKLSHRMGS